MGMRWVGKGVANRSRDRRQAQLLRCVTTGKKNYLRRGERRPEAGGCRQQTTTLGSFGRSLSAVILSSPALMVGEVIFCPGLLFRVPNRSEERGGRAAEAKNKKCGML